MPWSDIELEVEWENDIINIPGLWQFIGDLH